MAKILLIEDYPSLQKIYQSSLEAEKHSVKLAADGDVGILAAKKEEFDLILLDLLMPHADGLDFLRAYDVPKHPKTKVIIISNIYSTELLNQALKLGASHYLLKSNVTPKQLAKIVQDTLENKSKP